MNFKLKKDAFNLLDCLIRKLDTITPIIINPNKLL